MIILHNDKIGEKVNQINIKQKFSTLILMSEKIDLNIKFSNI